MKRNFFVFCVHFIDNFTQRENQTDALRKKFKNKIQTE